MRASVALLISGLAAQQVTAHWNRQASNYNTPQYNNNECTDKQKGGYDWSDLRDGDKPDKYDDFKFGGGWSCSSKFGKRDHLSKRTFGNKCITNKVKKDKPASFSCDKKKDGFSVTHIDVSVDHDSTLEFHWKMKDGSICKHKAPCKKDGTTVQNTQCGGAESVDVYLGDSSEGKEDCEIGFHNIGFDCNPGEQYTPPPPYTPAPPPAESTPAPPPEYTPPPSGECGGYGQPACPPEGECGGEGQPACETATPPPAESTSPPAGECGGYGQPSCEESTPPPAESTPPPAESSPPPIQTPICGEGYGPACANSTTPATPPPSNECGGYGQPACEETTAPPAESTPPPAESSPIESSPVESTPPPAESTPSGECGGYGQPTCEESTAPPAESTPPPAESTPVESTPVESTPVESTPPPAESTPSGECGGYGQPACETSAPPSESSPPPSESTPPPPPSGGNSSVPAPPSSTASPPTYTPPPGGYTPPECLPKCLNTWLKLKTECKDNTDSACYCKVPDLTDNVIDCVKAYGTDEEVKEALSYFVGICAPQLPENPAIISKCTDVPLAPPTPAPEAPAPPAPEAPVTTPAPGAPTPAPEAPAPAPPAEIPYTTVTYGGSSYTVPQVGFTTEAPDAPGANPTEPIALYPAPTPVPVEANPTPVAPFPIPSGASGFTSVPFPTGTGAVPSTPGEFTGAASSLNVQFKGVGVVFGAVLALFAL